MELGKGAHSVDRLLALVLLLLLAHAAQTSEDVAAADWPTIFGNSQNTSSLQDPKFKPPFRLRWATRIEGQMKSTPVVGGGRVYAQTVNGLITVLDQATGRILWRRFHPGMLPSKNEQNRTSPLYAEGRLYYAYWPGGLNCVDAASGKELWSAPDGARVGGNFSALCHEGLVFYPFLLPVEGGKSRYIAFKALDAASGKEVWRKEYRDFAVSTSALAPSPAVSAGCIGNGVLYVSLAVNEAKRSVGQGLLLALDPKSGKELWKNGQYQAGGSKANVAFFDGKLFVSGLGTPFRCLDAKTGVLLWEVDPGSKGTFGYSISAKGIALRTYGSQASVYDIATGKEVADGSGKKIAFGRSGSTGCSPLIIVNDEWGIQQSGGESRRLSVGRIDRSETVWEWQLAGRACPGSAVADGCIFTPSNGDGLLYCFEPDDGKAAAVRDYPAFAGVSPAMPAIGETDWPQYKFDAGRSGFAPSSSIATPLRLTTTVKLDAPCYGSPAVMGGKVFVVDAGGTAYGIDPGKAEILWKRATGGVNNRSSPIAVGGRIYLGSADGNFYVLNAGDGSVVKQLPMPSGVLASPALTLEGRIYAQSFDGTLFCLDLDANVRWTLKLKPKDTWLPSQDFAYAPHDVAAQGRDVLAVAGNTLFKVRDEGAGGKVIWTWHGTWSSGASFLNDGFFIGNAPQEMENQVLHALLDDKITGRVSGPNGNKQNEYIKNVWGYGRANAPPSVNATRACFGSLRSGFWCVDLAGQGTTNWSSPPTLWETQRVDRPGYQLKGAVGFAGAAALTREHCVFGGLDGKLYVIPLDAKGMGLDKIQPAPFVFDAPDGGMISSTPAVTGGCVYFTTEGGHLYGLGPSP